MNQIAIGNFIAEKRREKNMTQAALAQRLGVSNKTVFVKRFLRQTPSCTRNQFVL